MKLLPKSFSMRLWLSSLYMKYSISACRSNALRLCQDLKIQIIHQGEFTKDSGYYIKKLTFLHLNSALSVPCTCFWKWVFRNSFTTYCGKTTLPFHQKNAVLWFKHWLNFHNIRPAYKEGIKECVNTSLLGLWYVWKQNPIKPLYLIIFVLIKFLWVLLAVYAMKHGEAAWLFSYLCLYVLPL